ncbi:baseplate wedge protein 53 [bacterium]|nr:baseplate wedge protein 53 [bacterium]
MYFRQFEQGYYDLKGDGKEKLVTDLMTRVKVREKVIDEASLYDKYDVPSGERPEDTAFKHFGSSQYHWVILMTNNITDAYYEWPMSEQTFETFLIDKYAEPGAIHHYEVSQSSGRTSAQGPDDYSYLVEVNSDATGAQSVSNREYEQRLQDERRQIQLLNPSYLNTFLEEFNELVRT